MKQITGFLLSIILLTGTTFSADVTAIKALTGGKEVRFVYSKWISGTFNFFSTEAKYKIYTLDTRDNTEKQLCPGGDCNAKNYLELFFLKGGSRIAYSMGDSNKTYIVDFDGNNKRFICDGQITSVAHINNVQWLYVQKVMNGPIYRVNADNSSQTETVFNGGANGRGEEGSTFQTWFRVSSDGTYSTVDMRSGGPSTVTLPCQTSCTIKKMNAGCWMAMSPDASKHAFVMQAGHDNAIMFNSQVSSIGTINFKTVTGGSAWFIKWVNDANYNLMTMTGPGTGGGDNTGTNPGLYLAHLASNWLTLDQKVKINTDANSRYMWNDAYIGDISGGSTSSVVAPVISPTNPNFSDSISVTMTCATSGAEIYYTTNGSTPTTSSTKYTAPIVLKQTTTVKAYAVKSGMDPSAVVISDFVKTALSAPVISPNTGSAVDSMKITITGTQSIYYTTDGTNPTSSSNKYTAPFWIKASSTIKAISISGSNVSPITSANLTITYSNPIKVTQPNGGESFSVGQTMSIKWTTQNISQVTIDISFNNGLSWVSLQSIALYSSDPKWGNYPWVIPTTVEDANGNDVSTVSNKVKVRVVQYLNENILDISDNTFTITAAGNAVISPINKFKAEKEIVQFEMYNLAGAKFFAGNFDNPLSFEQILRKNNIKPGIYLIKSRLQSGEQRTSVLELLSN